MWITLRRCLSSKNMRSFLHADYGKYVFRWLCINMDCIKGIDPTNRPHVAIVGSGPAGFYTAQQILKVGIRVSGTPFLPSGPLVFSSLLPPATPPHPHRFPSFPYYWGYNLSN